MLRAQRAAYVAMAVVLDMAALAVAFLFVWLVRNGLGEFIVTVAASFGHDLKPQVRRGGGTPSILMSPNPLVNLSRHWWMLYLSIPAWLFFLNTQRGYDPQANRNGRQEFAICAYAGLLGTVAVLVFTVLFKQDISRLLVVGFLTIGVVMLWLERTVLLPLAQRRGRRFSRNILVIGPREAAARFAGILRTPSYAGSNLLGYITDQTPVANSAQTDSKAADKPLSSAAEDYVWDAVTEHQSTTHQSTTHQSTLIGKDKNAPLIEPRYIGRLSDLPAILDREVVDEVVLVRSAGDVMSAGDQRTPWGDVLELCLERGRTVSLVDEMVPPVGAKVEAQMIGSMPTLVLHNTPQNTLALVIKGAMDRTIAAIAVLLLLPVFAAIALFIKLHDKGPVFFRQKRVGLNGREFWFYKFRSMRVDAQETLEKMKREEPEKYRAINIMEEPFFKAKDGDDPRITPIGRIIRKTSLDELPQFWNVLRGDMSLVGPRPPLPKEVEELEPWQRRKLSVKGGLTCLWQASGRNEITDVDEWMRLDLEYIDNWSLWLDVKLLAKTVKVLLTSKGAS